MLCGCVLLMDGPATADDEVDCDNAMTQQDMNICAYKDDAAADAELNVQYKLTKKAMAEIDANLDDQMKGAAKALLAAQRAWIAYRDAECEAQGFQARGGSMEPMLVANCEATLSRQRTTELKELANGLEN
ncbi:MAG: lysozyme inhibitor LprI family protein [Allorhizobium sp.]